MTGPRVGLLIPAYNSEKTIAETLQSVTAQERLDELKSVYLADDGSTDATSNVATKEWSASVPLQIVASEKNLGERGNVNRAIKLARDDIDWVLLLHSDDLAKPGWLEWLLRWIQVSEPGVGSICCSWDTLTEGSTVPGENSASEEMGIIRGRPEAVADTLHQGCWWHISGCAIRLKCFTEVGEFDPILPQQGDWDWLLRCLEGGWAIGYIPKSLIVYREHAASISFASFRNNRDVLERLLVLSRHGGALNKSAFRLIAARQIYYLARRMGARLLKRAPIGRATFQRGLRIALTMTVRGSPSRQVETHLEEELNRVDRKQELV
ncbi:MAG: glycosyltransferase [Actinomycetota bacterium]|nr:glycosyltransferase [Actinomycetota bacterium]